MVQPSDTSWPEGCQGAVSLTFDDGLSSQLEIAVPMLNEHDLKATFYVNPRGDDWREKMAPWREVAKFGHEVGNHTVNHPCSRNFSGNITGGLESMTLADIETDIVEAQRRFKEGIPESESHTFCYPCYMDFVGEGSSRRSYVPIVARHFPAARGKGELANHPAACDLHYLSSWPAERMSGAELVGLAARSASEGRWGILTFHGIHQGHLPIADVDLRELCEFLARNRDRIWTATVAEVAERIIAWRKKESITGLT